MTKKMKTRNLRAATALMMAIALTSCGNMRGRPTLGEPLRVEVQAEQGRAKKMGSRSSQSILTKGEERTKVSAFGILRERGHGLIFSVPRKSTPPEAVEMARERATSEISAEVDMASRKVYIKVTHADGSIEESKVSLNGAFKSAERCLVTSIPRDDNSISFYFMPFTGKGSQVRQRGWMPGERIDVRILTVTSVTSSGPGTDSPTTEEAIARGIEVTTRKVRLAPTAQR